MSGVQEVDPNAQPLRGLQRLAQQRRHQGSGTGGEFGEVTVEPGEVLHGAGPIDPVGADGCDLGLLGGRGRPLCPGRQRAERRLQRTTHGTAQARHGGRCTLRAGLRKVSFHGRLAGGFRLASAVACHGRHGRGHTGQLLVTGRGRRAEAGLGQRLGLRHLIPIRGKQAAVFAAAALGGFDVAAQLTDAHAGAQVDFAHPDLEVAVVALAGIGGERRGLVADLRGLIDAGAFGQRGAGLLVADQRGHQVVTAAGVPAWGDCGPLMVRICPASNASTSSRR